MTHSPHNLKELYALTDNVAGSVMLNFQFYFTSVSISPIVHQKMLTGKYVRTYNANIEFWSEVFSSCGSM